ncbi:putative membrane protein [Janibacter sp. HTCC2649]|uniref:LytR C-terminal domain-containing protein n=1 Tax=Janibacter sp. HTCC2649 TaxID=313589 RepID=UPI0000670B3A|nr:LytR C-terminal domain-containing protein [Janibacter sp. HTCC2649]EAQ00576.1 putative membrane protein [Janibacter sp. HTCC2649]
MPQRELTSELRHRHQQRRTTATILVVILMLFFAFWYAYSYYRSSTGEAAPRSTSSACTPFNPKVATPANTTVNVYNATTKKGLAARTATELKRRGFTIGDVSNDPLKRKVAATEVRFGPSGKSRAQLLVPLGGKGTTQVADKRKSVTIDLVLGTSFTTLAPAPSPTGKPMCASPSTVPTSTPSASPSASSSAR